MNPQKETRLKQRYSNLKKPFQQLSEAIKQSEKKEFNNIEKAGMIQYYEFTFELCWKVMKDYLETEGEIVKGTRSVLKLSFQFDLLNDGDVWLEMLETRNRLNHTYKEENFLEAFNDIKNQYYPEIEWFINKMEQVIQNE